MIDILELNKIYNMDCLEGMDLMIQQGIKVDAIITDPPYGTTACKWDTIISFEDMWERLDRIIKPKGAVVLFGSEPFSSTLRMSNIKNFRYDIIWDKVKPSNFQMMNFQVGRVHEIISVFSDSPAVFCRGNNMNYYPQKTKREKPKKVKKTFYGTSNSTIRGDNDIKDLGERIFEDKHPTSILTFTNAKTKGRLHPTQKPVELIEYLIKTYTNEGDTVLDFTMGSGTTAIACMNTNRKFIGFELDEEYWKVANGRIENHKR